VSTDEQGRSGLGLDAQRAAIRQFCDTEGVTLVAEFVEVRSGKDDDRPELEAAIRRCRLVGTKLLAAKLDRVSRNVKFLFAVRDRLQAAGVDLRVLDIPDLNTLTLGIYATLAQHERELISARTRAALQAAKARGQILGGRRHGAAKISDYTQRSAKARADQAQAFAERVRPEIDRLRAEGLTLAAVAERLNQEGIRTSRAATWTPTAVKRVLDRLSA
jgi:DNA invertase Pin-like site-specific DNA recombinase